MKDRSISTMEGVDTQYDDWTNHLKSPLLSMHSKSIDTCFLLI
jgi:hypothetical protein